MQQICVFCGSSPGVSPVYRHAARQLGQLLAEKGFGLVYGGGSVGLMGALADAALAAGGMVTGVIPQAMAERGVAHTRLSKLIIVESMHARKAAMAGLASGFIALPGGFGTLEEMFEAITWAQLGYHPHPCGLLNTTGYFSPLVQFLDHAVDQGFISPAHRAMVLVEAEPGALLARFATYRPPGTDKLADALHHTLQASAHPDPGAG